MKKIDLTGKVFGELTVLAESGRNPGGQVRWLCECSCGTRVDVISHNLRKKQRSCGCLVKTQSGRSNTPEYRAWRAMLARCYNSTDASYENYGARGIEVCDAWRTSFDAFLADVGRRPETDSDGHSEFSLDRIDNEKNYEHGNVRWTKWGVQQNNRRSNRKISFDGEARTLAEWAAITGIGRATIAYRLNNGWSVEKALSRPPYYGKCPQEAGV